MKKIPFIYGSLVESSSFADRVNEKEKLYANLTNGINTLIISPRRWGKSSLVAVVFKKILQKNKDIRVVNIDLFSVNSEEEFLEAFAKEIIKSSSNKWEDWAKSGKEFFKQVIPRISFGSDPNTDFSISFNWNELDKHRNEILNLPETIARKKKIKFVIGLDEFQNLSTFPGYKDFEKNMRAIWQRQKNVTYCIYGSKRHMMTNIFDSSSKPFYRFGDIILLQKIAEGEWVKFIQRGFKSTNKIINKTEAAIIAKLMKNHPWYVQQLSNYTWNLTAEKVNKEHIFAALNEVINANSPLFQQEIEILSKTQLNLLKAIAKNEEQLSSTEVLQKYQLGTSYNVTKNKRILLSKDIIENSEKGFEFLDPVFEIWFKRYFFNINVSSNLEYLMEEDNESSK